MQLRAIFHKAAGGGFWAEVPGLPGCTSRGATFEEVETKLREAIQLHLALAEDKETDPNENRIMEFSA